MNPYMEFAHKTDLAYSALCHSLCRELNLPQTAFDILLFLANNPECDTASDIVELRKIKANLVSVNVNRLVEEGYLHREPVPGDRRKTRLICTEQGASHHRHAAAHCRRSSSTRLLSGMSDETAAGVWRCRRSVIDRNLDAALAGGALI